MPEVHDNDIQVYFIVSINTRSEKFNLMYTGRSEDEGNVHKFRLVPYTDT
jgi:hypothetical protein